MKLIRHTLLLLLLSQTCPAQTVDDYIALIDACHLGDLEGVKAGLAKGININQADRVGETPLIHALDAGQLDVAYYPTLHPYQPPLIKW